MLLQRTVIFLITDGFPTISPLDDTTCGNADGDCECGTSSKAVNSLGVYNQIKTAATDKYPNRMLALGGGGVVVVVVVATMSQCAKTNSRCTSTKHTVNHRRWRTTT